MNATVDRAAVRDMVPTVLGILPFGVLIGLTLTSRWPSGYRPGSGQRRRTSGRRCWPRS